MLPHDCLRFILFILPSRLSCPISMSQLNALLPVIPIARHFNIGEDHYCYLDQGVVEKGSKVHDHSISWWDFKSWNLKVHFSKNLVGINRYYAISWKSLINRAMSIEQSMSLITYSQPQTILSQNCLGLTLGDFRVVWRFLHPINLSYYDTVP